MNDKLRNILFKKKINKLSYGQYKVISNFKNYHTKVLCLDCSNNNIFSIRPDHLLYRNLLRPKKNQSSSLSYRMTNGHIDRTVRVRCPKLHRFELYQSQLPDYLKGKIKCPICKKLAILDPQYKNAHIEFDKRGDLLL